MSKRTHICSAGETFDAVALRLYGDEKYAADLMSENPELVNRTVFTGGERMRLPDIDMSDGVTKEDMPPWKR